MILFLLGLVMGFLSGLMGIGGGIIIVPALVLGFGMSQHAAQGISLMLIIPTVLSGLITYHRKGFVDYRMAGLLAVGSLGGAIFGASYVQYIPAFILKKIFGAVLALLGYKMYRDVSKRFILKGNAVELMDEAK
ncbi:sulfite exporter TauE/SafE family protein [Sporomusa sp. KB1]|uniref:sulfite exporter TauE/SafE family protein n=1 Tax=Sporomusa sp. KB1 TaxID=943346 RepID=UPI0011AC7883|nr:sulfite exporter TauE/SafE family protein [Sporomusa sp. KB1]TWH46958.1 hypothetical protein Salpa_2982 [Sporomusa sp. KB1]